MNNSMNTAAVERLQQYGIDPFVRIKFVVAATALSRATIYRLIASGNFPLPCHPTPHTTAWRLSVVRAWLEQREQTRPNRIRLQV
jgi:predicted DNA-binding transcriptional regulator AlpA